jgi:UDP-glucose 4-epimerase
MSADADVTAALAGRRILVTGGAGLVGSTLIDQLIPHEPAEIVVFDDFSRGRVANLVSALETGPVTIVEGDIRDRAAVVEAMRGIDLVYHEAAIRITRCAEEPRLALEVLADGTFNVIEAAVDEGVERVVAASSASVYGQADVLPTDETHHPWNNDTIYGAAKAFNEGVLRSFEQMRGLDYVALRYFNVYGPRMDIHGVYTEVLVRWMERIDEGLPPLIHGTGSHTMDFVYIGDVARANILASASSASDEVFNVASGVETSLLELAEALIEVMGSDVAVEFGPERAAAKVPRRLADTSLATERLGFSAEVGLEEGLQRLVEWWRAERARGGFEAVAARP